MVGQPLCLVAGARARGAWRVVLDDARGAAGSLRAALGSGASGRARMLREMCLVASRARWQKQYQGPRARRVMLVLYVSAARRGPVGRSVLVLLWRAPAFARVRVLAVLDTSAVGRLGTPICTHPREIPAIWG